MFNDKVIFITGGTGTWGQEIVKYLLNTYNVKLIIIFSRSEDKQVLMEKKINSDKLKFVLGDIRNLKLLKKITYGVDFLIHLAALKHIYKCNENQEEAISINIDGTKNIVEACIKNKIKKAIYISTDKAVEPFNLYGNTKAIGEKLFIDGNKLSYNNTVFFILRSGNILGSNGSVLKTFYENIKSNQPLTITDFNMKRFYILIEDVIELLEYSFLISKGGEIFIPKGDVLSLKNLVDIFLEIYGTGKEKILINGIKEGEKNDEILISNLESLKTLILEEKNGFLVDVLEKHKNFYKKANFNEYSTRTDYKKDELNNEYFKSKIVKNIKKINF